MKPDTNDVDRMISLLSITDAPLVRRGVDETIRFFRRVIGVDPFDYVEYVKGIDFHSTIRLEWVESGAEFVRYENLDSKRSKPFIYVTRSGTSEGLLGTGFAHYQFTRVSTVAATHAHVSRATGMAWGGRTRPGGGTQIILPTHAVAAAHRRGRVVRDAPGRPW